MRQGVDTGANRGQRLFGGLRIAAVFARNFTRQFALRRMVKQALQVGLGLAGQADPKAHRLSAGLQARAAPSLSCSLCKTASASKERAVRCAVFRDCNPWR